MKTGEEYNMEKESFVKRYGLLIGTGLVLFVITFLVNLLARRITEKAGK